MTRKILLICGIVSSLLQVAMNVLVPMQWEGLTLPFTPDEFFDVLAAYNERLWPLVRMLWLVTAYAVVMLTRARPVRPWFIPWLLAFHWAWSGLAYHAAFVSKINPAAWMFAGLFVLEAGLLVWYEEERSSDVAASLRWLIPDRDARGIIRLLRERYRPKDVLVQQQKVAG